MVLTKDELECRNKKLIGHGVCSEETMVVESKGRIKQIAESDCWRGITFKRRFIIVSGI